MQSVQTKVTSPPAVSFPPPAGAKVGHRSLMRYYKQRYGTQRTVALHHNRNAVGRVLRQYRALGWAGVGGETQDATVLIVRIWDLKGKK